MAGKEPASNIEWKEWGRYDPLWGVASWNGRNRDGVHPWTTAEFYELGELDWRDFLRYWERYGLSRSSVLEIGCGAGRITAPLAGYFQAVHAVDVSEDMIRYAKEHINVSSVNFLVSDGIRIPLPDLSVDAIFSSHVFQHFDSDVQCSEYFREMHRVLNKNGSIMIHIPILVWPFGIGRAIPLLFRIRSRISKIRANILRPLVKLRLIPPIMRGTSYTVEYIFDTLRNIGFEDIEIGVFATHSNNGVHHFVLARKSYNTSGDINQF